MSAQQASIPQDPGQQAEDAQYYRRILHGLIDMGADLAERLHKGVVARDEAAALAASEGGTATKTGRPMRDPTIPFACLTRSVRLTILLAQAIFDRPPPHNSANKRTAARTQIIREVEDHIQREAEPARAEALHAELCERLDSPEFERELNERPVDDIVEEICNDLGLGVLPFSHPHKRRTPAEVAILHARAAAPRGEAANPNLAITWPPLPTDQLGADPATDVARVLSAARFRGK